VLAVSKNIVADLRLSKGWSVNDLAKKLSVKKQTIYNWESGRTEPKLSQFLHLYALVGLDISNILPKRTKAKKQTFEGNKHDDNKYAEQRSG